MDLYKNREWLYKKYWEEELSTTDIANLCGRARSRIWAWLVKFNIPRRSQKKSLQTKKVKNKFSQRKGENHPTWGKPLSEQHRRKLSKAKWNKFKGKEGCRDAYNWRARKAWEKIHKKDRPKGYVIHHVDGNYRNNSIENLIAITVGEHNRIHAILRKRKSRESLTNGTLAH